MKLFCDICQNLLETDTSNDILEFKCPKCFSSYPSEIDDSLRYEETRGGNLAIFQTILKNAGKDEASLKAYVDCPKCKNNIAKQVRLGKELRLINICEKCDFQWLYV